jgi:hypothetical protein
MNRNALAITLFVVLTGCATSHTVQPVLKTVTTPTPTPICKAAEPKPEIVRFEYQVEVRFDKWTPQILMQAEKEEERVKIKKRMIDEAEFFVEVKGPHPYYERRMLFDNSKLGCKLEKEPCKLDLKLGELDFSFTVIVDPDVLYSPEGMGKQFISLFTGEKLKGPFQFREIKLVQANGTEEIRWQEEKENSAKGVMVVQLK